MIEYALRDADANELYLNEEDVTVQPQQGSVSFQNETLENDNRVVENTFLPGSVKLGLTRLRAREIEIRFVRAYGEDASAFRTAENSFIEFLQKTVALVDKTNDLVVPIAIADYNISYESGGHKLHSENTITVQKLDPFWKADTPDNLNGSFSSGTNNIAVNNQGNLVSPPIITLTATSVLSSLQVFVDETQEGIQIDDVLFGSVGFTTLVIDCENGDVLLSGIDRTSSILPSTGYFDLPIGASTLKIIANAGGTYDIDFNKRYYV